MGVRGIKLTMIIYRKINFKIMSQQRVAVLVGGLEYPKYGRNLKTLIAVALAADLSLSRARTLSSFLFF